MFYNDVAFTTSILAPLLIFFNMTRIYKIYKIVINITYLILLTDFSLYTIYSMHRDHSVHAAFFLAYLCSGYTLYFYDTVLLWMYIHSILILCIYIHIGMHCLFVMKLPFNVNYITLHFY